MTTVDAYIGSVLAQLPRSTPLREQIALELQGLIGERVEKGQPLAEVLANLGDPAALAESYLLAVPLVSAPLERRVLAKLVDAALVLGAVAVPSVVTGFLLAPESRGGLVVAAMLAAGFGFLAYTIGFEYVRGQTPGKELLGIRVVRESGAAIGLGQAFVRQLPILLSIFFIDVFFAPFTERKQRAFELLSKTRVVRA
ncbi:MAG: RDD family protein [Acidobacteria bacterium]|nr:RDD family protein [Acidobacteriota bacterium]